MEFKRGFLKRPNALGSGPAKPKAPDTKPGSGHAKVSGPLKTIPAPASPAINEKLYYIPKEPATKAASGQQAKIQRFRGLYNDPQAELQRRGPPFSEFEILYAAALGDYILVNVELGSNAFRDPQERHTIPCWVYPKQIEQLNQIVGPCPPGGGAAADEAGLKWGNVRPPIDLGGPRRDGESVLWEVRNVPGKGKGAFALRDIQFGEAIMVERPLQITPKARQVPDPSVVLDYVQYWDVLHDRRGPEQQARFDALFNCKRILPPGERSPSYQVANCVREGISRTNQLGLDAIGDYNHRYVAVFAAISRVNDSCTPNTAWDDISSETFSTKLRAQRPIKMGEELTAAYCPTMNVREDRRKQLKGLYLFDCNCDNCSLEGTAQEDSDRRRLEIKQWEATHITNGIWEMDVAKMRQHLIQENERMISIFEAEGMYAEVCKVYVELAHAYVKYSDRNNAQKYGNLALAALGKYGHLNGKSVDLDELYKIAADPQSHRRWGFGARRDKIAKAVTFVKPRCVYPGEFISIATGPVIDEFRGAFKELTDEEQKELLKNSVAGMAALNLSNPGNVFNQFNALNIPIGGELEALKTLTKGSNFKFPL